MFKTMLKNLDKVNDLINLDLLKTGVKSQTIESQNIIFNKFDLEYFTEINSIRFEINNFEIENTNDLYNFFQNESYSDLLIVITRFNTHLENLISTHNKSFQVFYKTVNHKEF